MENKVSDMTTKIVLLFPHNAENYRLFFLVDYHLFFWGCFKFVFFIFFVTSYRKEGLGTISRMFENERNLK